MKSGFLRRLRRDEKGTAAIEFAFLSVMFFAVIIVALDFAMYIMYRQRLGAAIEQGSMLAFNNRASIDTSQLNTYISTSSNLPGSPVTVSLKCNGADSCTNTNRQCACLSSDGQSFTVAGSCGASCSDGSTSGYYLGIVASYPYQSVVVPNKWLAGSTISRSSMVRLQ